MTAHDAKKHTDAIDHLMQVSAGACEHSFNEKIDLQYGEFPGSNGKNGKESKANDK